MKENHVTKFPYLVNNYYYGPRALTTILGEGLLTYFSTYFPESLTDKVTKSHILLGGGGIVDPTLGVESETDKITKSQFLVGGRTGVFLAKIYQ